MKKNILKSIIILILVLALLFVINFIRNYTILKKYQKASLDALNNCNNYYFEQIMNIYGKTTDIVKVFFLDNTYKIQELSFEELSKIVFTQDGDIISKYGKNFDSISDISQLESRLWYGKDSAFPNNDKLFSLMLGKYLFKPILVKNDYGKYYVVKTHPNRIYYINKETNLVEKIIGPSSSMKILTNIVTSEDLI